MSQHVRRTMIFSVVLVMLLALLAGGIAAQEEKVLIIGAAESVDSLDPARGFSFTPLIVHKATYDALVTFPPDSTATIEPRLAESWEVSDDGLTYTFKLREGVKFASGNPLTAADAAFSFNRMKNIKGNPAFLADSMDHAEATDDTTLVVTLKQPDPAFLPKLVFSAFGVVDSKLVKENGGTDAADADTTDTADAWFSTTSAGTGPYVLESYEKEVELVLARNPNYWGTPPYFDRVIFTHIGEAASQKVALEAGDIDLALDITPDQVAAIEATPGLKVNQVASPTLHYLAMNRNPEIGGPMADPKVNLAVRYALDYDGLRMLNSPNAITPPSMLPVGFFGAYGQDKALKRDVDKAKALLAEAGYADGFEVKMTYWTTTFGGVNFDTMAQKIQADLADVGITVTLDPVEFSVWIEAYRAANLPFTYAIWVPDYIDPGDYLAFVPAHAGGTVVANRVSWTEENADPEILELRDKAEVELDSDKRAAEYAQMQDYWQQSGPWAPFLQPVVQRAFKDTLQGPTYHPQWLLDVAQLSRSG